MNRHAPFATHWRNPINPTGTLCGLASDTVVLDTMRRPTCETCDTVRTHLITSFDDDRAKARRQLGIE